jgi:hypothetical protein
MQIFPHTLPRIVQVLVSAFIVLGLFAAHGLSAQAFTNGDFESGAQGWTGCLVEIGTESDHGGTGDNMVALVNGDGDPELDHLLCQTITGFIVGGAYRLGFHVSRSGNGNSSGAVTVAMSIDNDAMYRTITRSGGYAMAREEFNFVASLETHEFLVEPYFDAADGLVFDNFTLEYISPMPIELLYFRGEVSTSGVQLSWATATEQNCDHFNVQRSLDALEWHDLMEVQGAGSSSAEMDYTVVDPAPFPGLSYYRLKQVDLQGGETIFSAVPVHAEMTATADLAVFPNPSNNGQLWLTVGRMASEMTVPVSINDIQGRLVHREIITMAPGVAVDLTRYVDLNKGLYLVTVPVAGVLQGVRVVVQ